MLEAPGRLLIVTELDSASNEPIHRCRTGIRQEEGQRIPRHPAERL
jgi:hypothetical protein